MNKREASDMTRSEASVASWRTSTHSGSSDNCVEVASLGRTIVIRDSKDPDGPRIYLSQIEWTTLLRSVQCNPSLSQRTIRNWPAPRMPYLKVTCGNVRAENLSRRRTDL